MPSSALTLTLWIAEEIAPGATPAGRMLKNQLDAFTAANPNIHIQVVPKKSYGKGGLLDLIMTTHAVLPSRLPDLITLDLSEVPLAAQAGILYPLDGILPIQVNGDFFPFAVQASRYANQWVSVPFASNVEHLVYNRVLVRKAPQTWDELTKQKGTLLLPLGGDAGFLLQYLSLRPTPNGATSLSPLDVSATTLVLSFIKQAHDLGLMPETALNFKTADEVWPTFAAGRAAMAQVSASRYLTERSKLPNALYAAVPTRGGKVTTLATGWSLAIVTRDPARQEAAARFIQWIVQGERLAPWLRAAHLLPTSRSTLLLTVDPPEYAGFLQEQLEGAAPLPPASTFSGQAEAWRAAIGAVWNGQMTPDEAARNAAGAK